MIIGITGTICSGKSYVRECFESIGKETLDTDELAYQLYDPYSPKNRSLTTGDRLYKAIADYFGSEIIEINHPFRRLDNPKLRAICLASPQHLLFISEVANRYLRMELSNILEQFKKKDSHFFVEAPMLFEYKWCRSEF